MKKAIIFDFFGVISTEVAPIWFEKRMTHKSAQPVGQIMQPIDIGEKKLEELFVELSNEVDSSPEEIAKEWEGLVDIDFDLVSKIEALQNKYKIGLCSNAPSLFIRKIIDNNDLPRLFDYVAVSSELGLVKPEEDIYLKTSKELGVKNEECFFIDDNPNNIKTANVLGMSGILYSSLNDLDPLFSEN